MYPIEKFPGYYEADRNDVTWQQLKYSYNTQLKAYERITRNHEEILKIFRNMGIPLEIIYKFGFI